MEAFFDRVMTKLPNDIKKEKTEVYSSTNMSIVKVTGASTHAGTFPHYQFLSPINNTPPILIDNKMHLFSRGTIIVCNPGQFLKASDSNDPNCTLLAVLVEKAFLHDTSKLMFNSESIEFENKCFPYSPKIGNFIDCFIKESIDGQPGFEIFLQSISIQIVITMLREGIHSLSNKTASMKSYSDNMCIRRAVEFLTEHYDKNISLDELSREVNYSAYHFLRIFKTSTGMTPFEYLLNVKIEKAKALLEQTNYSITRICYLCGFSSTSHFNQAFKRKIGISPSLYRKNFN